MINQEIKRGDYNAYYPISELKMATVNRDTVIKHAENFKSKLNDYGWMMPIVVSSKGDVIEGHHRIESAKLLKQKTIPAYIIEWVELEVTWRGYVLNRGTRVDFGSVAYPGVPCLFSILGI